MKDDGSLDHAITYFALSGDPSPPSLSLLILSFSSLGESAQLLLPAIRPSFLLLLDPRYLPLFSKSPAFIPGATHSPKTGKTLARGTPIPRTPQSHARPLF